MRYEVEVMNRYYFTLMIAGLLISACADKKSSTAVNEAKSADTAPMTLEDHVQEIMDMWPGSYRNDEQIKKIEEKGGKIWRIDDSGQGGHLDITSHYIKIDKPDIGDHVLYVEEYRDGVPDETYRQRIYTLSIDDSLQMVRVKMWPFKDKKKYIGSWEDLSMLDSLSEDQLTAFPDICDLLVKPLDGKYHMYMNKSDCTFGTRTFNYEVMLSADRFSYRDKIYDSEKDSTTSAANFEYHDLDPIN